MDHPYHEVPPPPNTHSRPQLSSTDVANWWRLFNKISTPEVVASRIAPRWRNMMELDWGSLPDKPSPLRVERASRQRSVEGALLHPTRLHQHATTQGGHRIALNFPTKGRAGVATHKAAHKKKSSTTIEPLRGSDANGNKAAIHRISAGYEPRRIHHNRRSIWKNFWSNGNQKSAP